jgi:hypothetical protein
VKIAIGLMTADRPEYTRRTLESFAAHNDLGRFTLLHADDGSETVENSVLARKYGFEPTCSAPIRTGQRYHLLCLAHRAEKLGCDWYFHL